MSTPQKSLRAQRKARGWSVSQLEQLSGVAATTIRCAERGLNISPANKRAMVAALAGKEEPPPRMQRGFARMHPEELRELASKAGKASHESGRGHEFSAEEAREAGRKGGLETAAKRDMSALARLGGIATAEKRRQQIQKQNHDKDSK